MSKATVSSPKTTTLGAGSSSVRREQLIRMATWLYDAGYNVLAVFTDKCPTGGSETYQKERPDWDTCCKSLTRKTCRGLGVVTGRVSNVIVLDIDAVSEIDLLRTHVPKALREGTLWHKTPRGFRFWFQYAGSPRVTSGAYTGGIHVRADGDFCVCPPCDTTTKFQKPVCNAVSLPTIPRSLVAAIMRRTPYGEPEQVQRDLALWYWDDNRIAIREGKRTTTLYRAASYFLRRSSDPYRVVCELVRLAVHIDGLPQEEAICCTDNALSVVEGQTFPVQKPQTEGHQTTVGRAA